MSHFSILVVTDEEPTEEVVARILQPWHEYECDGVNDEYVVEVDVTDRMEEVWNEDTAMLKLADGSIHCRYDEKFYVGPPKDEFDAQMGRKSFVMPLGATEITIPRHEQCAMEGQTKTEFAQEYGHWTHRDGRFFEFTNPNHKWDGWTIGGRWSGSLQVVSGAESRTGERSWTNEDDQIIGVDQAQYKNLDLAAMKSQAQHELRKWAEDCCTKAELTMDDLNIACRIAPLAHEKWMALDEDSRPRGAEYAEWMDTLGGDYSIYAAFRRKCFELPDVPEGTTLIEWIDAAPTISAWAVVQDNQWFERGEMGWFGMSHNEKEDWGQTFNNLFDLIKPDQWVSIVDCHT